MYIYIYIRIYIYNAIFATKCVILNAFVIKHILLSRTKCMYRSHNFKYCTDNGSEA